MITTLALILAQTLLSPPDLLARPRPKADHKIGYGPAEQQFAELWLPQGEGPHPVVVLIHGGCWRGPPMPGPEVMAHAAEALRKEGFAVWNLGYRRVGQAGGGYPGTFLDLGQGADALRGVAEKHRLDLAHVVAAGHSAGGHLALWLAARHRLPADSPLHKPDPLKLTGVVSLAGPGDLRAFAKSVGSCVCGPDAIPALVNEKERGEPAAFGDTSPAALLPLGVPQTIVTGIYDMAVPPALALRYRAAAIAKGDKVELANVPDAGHFEVIAPWTPAWTEVVKAIRALR